MKKPRFLKILGCDPGCILTKYVYIDFKNDETFREKFDGSETPKVCLGVRLAAQGLLRKSFCQIIDELDPSVQRLFTVRAVLESIVTRALNSKSGKGKILHVVLHLDEFQNFVDKFEDPRKGRDALKTMLLRIRSFMASGMKNTAWEKQFFITLVLTGTAAYDLSFLTTDRMEFITIALPPLTQESCLRIFDSTYKGLGYKKELLAKIASQDLFLILLADTGYVPHYVVQLFRKDIKLATTTPWGEYLKLISVRKHKKLFGGPKSTVIVIKVALAGQPVSSSFELPCGKTIGDLERAGDLFLERVAHDSRVESFAEIPHDPNAEKFYVRLPFVQLVAANEMLLKFVGEHLFPANLLFYPSMDHHWRWQQFEELHGYFQALKMKSLVDLLRSQTEQVKGELENQKVRLTKALKMFEHGFNKKRVELASQIRNCETRLKKLRKKAQEGFTLSEIFCGALGNPKTLSRRVVIENFDCFHEKHQWISSLDEAPDVVLEVACRESRKVNLFKGVFLCCPGNHVFDGRFCCHSSARDGKPSKRVLVVWQDKHSELGSKTSVCADDINLWHMKAQQVLREWHGKRKLAYFFMCVCVCRWGGRVCMVMSRWVCVCEGVWVAYVWACVGACVCGWRMYGMCRCVCACVRVIMKVPPSQKILKAKAVNVHENKVNSENINLPRSRKILTPQLLVNVRSFRNEKSIIHKNRYIQNN